MGVKWWPEVESHGGVEPTDTRIFKLIGLPWRIVRSYRYCTLTGMV